MSNSFTLTAPSATETPNGRDLRNIPTLAQELERELRLTARIQADPLGAGHFPFRRNKGEAAGLYRKQ